VPEWASGPDVELPHACSEVDRLTVRLKNLLD
jgi:hypothetical protein